MKHLVTLGLFSILILGLSGCITPAPGPRSQFYLLQPASDGMQETPAGDGPVVRIGPVQVSEYLNRPQLATRIGGYQIAYDELRRWAEPLCDNIQWVLAKDISGALKEARVISFTEMPTLLNSSLSVPVRVSRLEQRPDGTVLLQASWLVIRNESPHAAIPESITLTRTAASGATEDMVAAQSKLIHELAEKIAGDIRQALP